MSTTVYAKRDGCDCLMTEVGYRCGIGDHRTAFVWLVPPEAMEQYEAFIDDWGERYDRLGLMDFIANCDELHPLGCECVRHGPPPYPQHIPSVSPPLHQ